MISLAILWLFKEATIFFSVTSIIYLVVTYKETNNDIHIPSEVRQVPMEWSDNEGLHGGTSTGTGTFKSIEDTPSFINNNQRGSR